MCYMNCKFENCYGECKKSLAKLRTEKCPHEMEAEEFESKNPVENIITEKVYNQRRVQRIK